METLEVERKTVHAMIKIFCRAQHNGNPLCDSCKDLEAYVDEHLDNCPFGWEKPTCKNCRVHCYQPEMRAQIKEVMRFSGPRMIFHHPILTFRHLLKSTRN